MTLWARGGAWFLGDRIDGAEALCAGPADRGAAVASIDYRLGEALSLLRTPARAPRFTASA